MMACTVMNAPQLPPPPVVSLEMSNSLICDIESPPEVHSSPNLLTLVASRHREEESSDELADDLALVESSWNPCLYSLQLRAPKALPLVCDTEVDEDHEFSSGYHGLISKADAIELLWNKQDGVYLVRKTMSGKFILSFCFNEDIHHYTIQLKDGNLVNDDKEYHCTSELVNDRLIQLYIEKHENLNQKLTQGQQSHSRTDRRKRCYQHRRHAYRRKRPNSQSSLNSIASTNDLDSTDGLSPTPSLSSLTDSTIETEPIATNLDQSGIRRQHKGGSAKVVSNNTSSFLALPRCATESSTSSPASPLFSVKKKKAISTGDLPNLQGMLAGLIVNTIPMSAEYTENGEVPFSRSSSRSSHEKSHNFCAMTFKRPTWCNICHHFMWGLVQQGLTCQDCGINVHKQCLEAAHNFDCVPSRKTVKGVFGVDLTTLVMVEGGFVPQMLQLCVAYVENNCLSVEGIYRVSGVTSKVLDIKEKFDECEPIQWNDIQDGHVITGAIKLYFRELPNPVIAYDVYPLLIQAVKDFTDNESFSSNVRRILTEELPRSHYDTLKFFIQHLCKVAQYSDANKMLPSNLAVVFAPTLMKSADDDGMNLANIKHQQKFIKLLIENFDSVFVEN